MIYFNKKVFAMISFISCLSVVNSATVDVSIPKAEIKTQENTVSVSPFSYVFAGKKQECAGKIFIIKPTKLNKMQRRIMLKASSRQDYKWIFMPNKLPVRNIVDFKLVDKNGKKLQEGVDYHLNRMGAVSQLNNKTGEPKKKPIPATASFSYFPERYDSIFFDPENGLMSVVQGVVRIIDAEEYIPAMPAGKIRLCNIAVTGDNIRIIPTYAKANVIVKGDLTAFIKKLKAGKPVKVLGYGDSITAVQKGRLLYTPNSKAHDRYEGYLSRFPKDTVALVKKFDFNDGVGKKHCKLGWNWKLVETIEKKYGNKVEYFNCGIGGTCSAVTRRHGLFPERIKAALAVKPDLVVLAFGMNELGKTSTKKNVDEIIKRFKAVGADVIVMGVPQINGTRSDTMDKWQKTNDILRKVAQANNCPFVDTTQVNLGIIPEHVCSSNRYNHPGINELKKYGEALAEVLE